MGFSKGYWALGINKKPNNPCQYNSILIRSDLRGKNQRKRSGKKIKSINLFAITLTASLSTTPQLQYRSRIQPRAKRFQWWLQTWPLNLLSTSTSMTTANATSKSSADLFPTSYDNRRPSKRFNLVQFVRICFYPFNQLSLYLFAFTFFPLLSSLFLRVVGVGREP